MNYNDNNAVEMFVSFMQNQIKNILSKNNKNLNIKQSMFKYLDVNHATIKIKSAHLEDSLEFARIASTALEDVLLAKVHVKTNGKYADLEVSIPGPNAECMEAISQLNAALNSTFNKKTGCKIYTQFIANKKSSYQALDIKVAEINYKKFQQKIASKL